MEGKSNITTDKLFKNPSFHVIIGVQAGWKAKIIAEYTKDKFASDILDGKLVDERLKIKDGLILYKNRIYLVLE